MEGKLVRIRPVQHRDLEILESWVNNVQEIGEFNDFGFETHEGVLRKAQWRHGDWHDMVLYSKLRGE